MSAYQRKKLEIWVTFWSPENEGFLDLDGKRDKSLEIVKKNNTFFLGPKMEICYIETVLHVERQLFYEIDFHFRA